MMKKENTEKICIKRKSALPLWVCAAVWVLAGLFYPMYRTLDILIVAVVSLVAWLITWIIAPEYKEYVNAPRPTSGNADADALCTQLESEAAHLTAAAELLPAERAAFAARLGSVGTVLRKIAKNLQADPSDFPKCRRLAGYYLPVMRKLCDKYIFLLKQSGGDTEGVQTLADIETKIEDAFAGIDSALKKQLDALYKNDDLDISTDIDVLSQMLRRDGLADD